MKATRRTRGGRKRGSALKAAQEEYAVNVRTWEQHTGLRGGFHRPGSQQRDRRD